MFTMLSKLSLLAGIAMSALVALPGRAAPIPYPDVGTPNPSVYSFTAASSGDVIAYFAGSGASYDEQLGLFVNGLLTASGFGLDDHSTARGASFDLGAVTAGDKLVFAIDVLSPPLGFVYSDPSLNTAYDTSGVDGHNHIYSTSYSAASGVLNAAIPNGTYVAFEDLPFPLSDFNYGDEQFVFTNVITTVTGVPEPATVALFGMALTGLAAARCRRT